jgi:hypothetical protein
MCKTPVGDGSYIDLNAYGFEPVKNAPASNSDAPLQITLNEIYKDSRAGSGEKFSLYGADVTETAKTSSLYVHSNGMIEMQGRWHPVFGAATVPYNDDYSPFYLANMGVFWHGAAGFGGGGMQFGAPYSLDDNGDGVSGISFSQLVDENNIGSHVIIEWDNLQHVVQNGPGCGFRGCPPGTPWVPNDASDSKLDAQVIIARDYNSAPGSFELIYAYDNLNFQNFTGNGGSLHEILSLENSAIAGVIGFSTPIIGGKAWGGFHRQSINPDYDGFGKLDQFLQDDMKVCFDYSGPEVSAFDINFTVKVENASIGQNFDIKVVADIEGKRNIYCR